MRAPMLRYMHLPIVCTRLSHLLRNGGEIFFVSMQNVALVVGHLSTLVFYKIYGYLPGGV